MRLREIFRYEVEHRLRSPSTWIYTLFLFAVAFVLVHAHADSERAVSINAPSQVALGAMIVGMVGMLVSAALFGDAAVRDVESDMESLLFTAPISRWDYLGGRFLAALTVNAAMAVAIPLGLWCATLMPYLEREAFGPLIIGGYVQAYAIFVLPNLLITGALLFGIAVIARQTIPVYLAAILIFIGYLVGIQALESIGNPILAALLDPVAIGALSAVTQYWTPAERNTRLVGVAGELLVNRALWMGIAAGVLVLVHRRFRFAQRNTRRTMNRVPNRGAVADTRATGPVVIPAASGAFGPMTTCSQALAIARRSLAETAGSPWFVVVLAICAGLTIVFGMDRGSGAFDTSTLPRTLLIAETVTNTPLVPILYMLIAMYAGELVWKDRETGSAEIADATPAGEGAAVIGRLLALAGMLAMIQGAFLVGGVTMQALSGYRDFELGLYVRILFGFVLTEYLLLAVLATAVHVVVNHKYLGHVAVLVVLVGRIVVQEMGVVRHHLLVYGTDPGWSYSDMNGFGPFVEPILWFRAYWGAIALLVGIVTTMLWVRGRPDGFAGRLRGGRRRVSPAVPLTAATAAILIGGFVFYNTNVLNDYRASERAEHRLARYEREFGRFRAAPQPTIVRASLQVEIHPEDPAAEIRGSYRLVNRTSAPIDSVHLAMADPALEVGTMALDRPATTTVDDETAYRVFDLADPLLPGDSATVTFEVANRPRGFPNERRGTSVVSNGTSFHRGWLPFVGYQPVFELGGDDVRTRHGLGARVVDASTGQQAIRWEDAVEVDAVIGTAAGQTALTPGVLRRRWSERGRDYFHYRTDGPVSFGAPIFSARYAATEARWKNVVLRVLHHPDHDYNVERMVRSMKASLDYFTVAFGPVGSSRVDLQACKLEYSIVSPK